MLEEKLSNIKILDIEPRNHLEKDCDGDVLKLKLGIAGIKFFNKDRFLFFDETNIDELEDVLLDADIVIGYNLVGHNGLDYKILENYGIFIEPLIPKTFDLMTTIIRTFGSYKGISLDNIAENTFGIKKKNTKKANYKLIQSKQIDKVESNLKLELTIIEMLYKRVLAGGIVKFKTPFGLIDEHELPPFAGIFPNIDEEITEPYDLPLVGLRLQIKDKSEKTVRCKKCKKYWRIKSICYYGDTISQKVHCPMCGNLLTNVSSNMFREQPKISEIFEHNS